MTLKGLSSSLFSPLRVCSDGVHLSPLHGMDVSAKPHDHLPEEWILFFTAESDLGGFLLEC